MKILSSSRFDSMQSVIKQKSDLCKRQATVISLLEQENIKLAARVAELEATLHAYGVIDRYGQLRIDSTARAKVVTEVLDRLEAEA